MNISRVNTSSAWAFGISLLSLQSLLDTIWPQQLLFISVILGPHALITASKVEMLQLYAVEWTATVKEENYHTAALISSLSFKQDKSNINSAVNF